MQIANWGVVASGVVVLAFLFGGGLHHAWRWVGLARKAPELASAMSALFARVGVSPRSFDILELPMANALAFPITRRLYVTRGLLDALTSDEVEAVVAHEMGHLREGRLAWLRTLSAVWMGAVGLLAPWLDLWWFMGAYGVGLVVILVAYRRITRVLERRADRIATELVSPVTYARALERIYEHNLVPAVLQRRATHPSLYDRMLEAGVTPEYPRPAAPARGAPAWLILGVVLGAMAGVAVGGATMILTGAAASFDALARRGKAHAMSEQAQQE